MSFWEPPVSAFQPTQVITATLRVRGAVQGVGFRPTVFRLAHAFDLGGWVRNDRDGVTIRATGSWTAVRGLAGALRREPPPASRIDDLEWLECGEAAAETADRPFRILDSPETTGPQAASTPPDLAMCADCAREILDPSARRHAYPFTNCTNCGPRYSIIEAFPYDRSRTTMKAFSICPDCAAEYHDPADRRFHAQPIACPACGPHLRLLDPAGRTLQVREDALTAAGRALREGAIVALKGLGGFQLLVDARSPRAVATLRQRKARPDKPFAVMFPTREQLRRFCALEPAEEALLTSPAAPIVLLRRNPRGDRLAPGVSGGCPRDGAMLPYTPLHALLMRDLGFPLVATSGNRSEEPICIDEAEALDRLGGIADLFLVHDRPIARPLDDSVAVVAAGRPLLLRAARGYAPLQFQAPAEAARCLAAGAQQKNTLGLSSPGRLLLSSHIGDLGSPAANAGYRRALADLTGLFGEAPTRVACDLHPDYDSTRLAEGGELPLVRVPHHLAHALACRVDNALSGPALAVVWDGSGFGPDQTVWGGEFLWIGPDSWRRAGHFTAFPLPGGENAVREPRRIALALLAAIPASSGTPSPAEVQLNKGVGNPSSLGGRGGETTKPGSPLPHPSSEVSPSLKGAADRVRALFSPEDLRLLETMLARRVNCPPTTSAGRLFDGVAALLDLDPTVSYEGQAAMALETLAWEAAPQPPYPFDLVRPATGPFQVGWEPIIRAMAEDLAADRPRAEIAAAFHETLAAAIVGAARQAGETQVLLTGGCFQNVLLLERALERLRAAGFQPFWPLRAPPNDGGIALGQLAACLSPERERRVEDVSGHSR